ncbi:hypothetical protein MAPG_07358 [Magnaporthiopsis poae ATCC 64411]|uniref:Uncharacterized protein n=1 Tax=Magnaporthiopsis poae (strain ATCC 64411 / 73-15) TaxID=644358 RepID=A0A0C4E4G4_MAGP6|nr:hypothetical protein MAPG_07358 [Magnaporthiopsis poae ATCC 64411]
MAGWDLQNPFRVKQMGQEQSYGNTSLKSQALSRREVLSLGTQVRNKQSMAAGLTNVASEVTRMRIESKYGRQAVDGDGEMKEIVDTFSDATSLGNVPKVQ